MLIDFSTRVLLVGLKAPLDRLRPDDSILASIRIFGRFDNEASRDALECLVSHASIWGTLKDRVVWRNVAFGISLPIYGLPKQPYRAKLIQASTDLNSSIIRLVVRTVFLRCCSFAPCTSGRLAGPVGIDTHPVR